jgi:hypothetical protein
MRHNIVPARHIVQSVRRKRHPAIVEIFKNCRRIDRADLDGFHPGVLEQARQGLLASATGIACARPTWKLVRGSATLRPARTSFPRALP